MGASVWGTVPVYSPAFAWYSSYLPTEGWMKLWLRPVYIQVTVGRWCDCLLLNALKWQWCMTHWPTQKITHDPWRIGLTTAKFVKQWTVHASSCNAENKQKTVISTGHCSSSFLYPSNTVDRASTCFGKELVSLCTKCTKMSFTLCRRCWSNQQFSRAIRQ